MRKLAGLVVVLAVLLSGLAVSIPSANAGIVTCPSPDTPVVVGGSLFACIGAVDTSGGFSPFPLGADVIVFVHAVEDLTILDAKLRDPNGVVHEWGGFALPVGVPPFTGRDFFVSDYVSTSGGLIPGTYEAMFLAAEGGSGYVGGDGIGALQQVDLRVSFDVPFTVLPESPIGVAALITASLGVLGAFAVLRRGNKLAI